MAMIATKENVSLVGVRTPATVSRNSAWMNIDGYSKRCSAERPSVHEAKC
jgi:hypothetical protein